MGDGGICTRYQWRYKVTTDSKRGLPAGQKFQAGGTESGMDIQHYLPEGR